CMGQQSLWNSKAMGICSKGRDFKLPMNLSIELRCNHRPTFPLLRNLWRKDNNEIIPTSIPGRLMTIHRKLDRV
ncbi:hypothetical protein T265_16350, partial [Opisthorchis viverrini]